MKLMFDGHVAPAVTATLGRRRVHVVRRDVYCYGAGESTVALRLGRLMDQSRNPKVGTLASSGMIQVKIVGTGTNRRRLEREVNAVARKVRKRLGQLVYSGTDPRPAAAVIDELRRRGMKIAVAESCTGGLVTARLVDVPGASDVVLEGVVAYSNEAKMRRLGIEPETIDRHGAVSLETAAALARGARKSSGADIGVGVTGVAGPSGGTAEKPVGLVWFAVADTRGTTTRRAQFRGSRDEVRERAARTALDMVRRRLIRR
jgi:nicotinamide-nucleotide amidase